MFWLKRFLLQGRFWWGAPVVGILAAEQILEVVYVRDGDIFCKFADWVAGEPLFFAKIQLWMKFLYYGKTY